MYIILIPGSSPIATFSRSAGLVRTKKNSEQLIAKPHNQTKTKWKKQPSPVLDVKRARYGRVWLQDAMPT